MTVISSRLYTFWVSEPLEASVIDKFEHATNIEPNGLKGVSKGDSKVILKFASPSGVGDFNSYNMGDLVTSWELSRKTDAVPNQSLKDVEKKVRQGGPSESSLTFTLQQDDTQTNAGSGPMDLLMENLQGGTRMVCLVDKNWNGLAFFGVVTNVTESAANSRERTVDVEMMNASSATPHYDRVLSAFQGNINTYLGI